MGGFTSMEVVGKILSKAESRKPKAESRKSQLRRRLRGASERRKSLILGATALFELNISPFQKLERWANVESLCYGTTMMTNITFSLYLWRNGVSRAFFFCHLSVFFGCFKNGKNC